MEREFTYHWRHLGSGKEGTKTITCLTEEEFLRLLGDWNRVGATMTQHQWQYWAA